MDVRIIAATNRTAAGAGKGPSGLRDDIVARLGAAPFRLPPLRDRVEDLGALVGHFLRATPGVTFEQPAFRALCLHTWPLNVRELEKIVTTAAVLSAGAKPISLRDLPEPIAHAIELTPATGQRRATGPSPTPAQLEELLRRYEGNVADVSRELGKHRAAVWRWIKKFGIGPQKFRKGADAEDGDDER
jgi:DNA-binding NtrC family response regulator